MLYLYTVNRKDGILAMNISSFTIQKKDVVYVTASTTMRDALIILEDHQFRCIPILDDNEKIFRGNIYRSHLYQRLAEGQSLDEPVTLLLKNATKYVSVDSSFYRVLFNIRDLPYIAVLDQDNRFFGLLTHHQFERMLSHSWKLNDSSYILTVTVPQESRGTMSKVTKIISRVCSINSMITLTDLEDPSLCHLTFFLSDTCSYPEVQKIVARLKRRGLRNIGLEEPDKLFEYKMGSL